MIQLPDVNWLSILPALVLCIAGLVVLFVGLFVRKGAVTVAGLLSLAGIVGALMANAPLRTMHGTAFAGMVAADAYCWFLNILILVGTGLTVLISMRYLSDEHMNLSEYFVLILFSAAGMIFMISASHILVIFVGLETLSISIYVLAGMHPASLKSRESALKYLLLGGFSSGIFLYGAALMYGATGSLDLVVLTKFFAAGKAGLMAKAGMGLLLVGFGFKVAAVPFHMWTPDVYEGAPTPITGYMSVAVKVAAFAAFIRVFLETGSGKEVNWVQVLWVVSAITMIVGNLVALVQQNIKRMLAYSSIAHAGYILVGMVAGGPAGTSGILYYLLAYTFTNLGAFGVVALVGREGEANVMIDDYRGLAKVHPLLALAMAIFLFSLAGIPPTAGFIGKFTIFSAAVAQHYYWLVVIGVLTSAASVFYYFRVVMRMYMEAPETEPSALRFGPAMVVSLIISVAGVLYMGIFPTTYLNLALESVKPLF
jgi:NADH-quinone oxidoreductase subunit N